MGSVGLSIVMNTRNQGLNLPDGEHLGNVKQLGRSARFLHLDDYE
jgi:hypothetical protein